jgi:TusA-related sulfurtransferase
MTSLNYHDIKQRVQNGEILESIADDYSTHKSNISEFCTKYNIKSNKGGRRKGVSNKDMQNNAGTFLEEFWKIIQKDIK